MKRPAQIKSPSAPARSSAFRRFASSAAPDRLKAELPTSDQPRRSLAEAGQPRRSLAEAGVALVITLIMVSVIAFMAVTFLYLSSRERGSVSTASNQTDARLAAESGLQRAAAQLLAPIIVSGNPDNYQLLVSTNYINPLGFNKTPGDYPINFTNHNITNVNFDYYSDGTPITSLLDQQTNLLNLLIDPRPPVFITDKLTGKQDFRFYLDLNRNGRYDTNGVIPVIIHNTTANTDEYLLTNGTTVTPSFADYGKAVMNLHLGDPEWIGVLERPELPHSSSNKFISRYAFIALPVGKTLDVNFIHNQAKGPKWTTTPNGDGFFRNQGVGSWEINLAAFLADLNTNEWNNPLSQPYAYNFATAANPSTGSAFSNAFAALSYRYASSYTSLTNPAPPPDSTNVDEYANGDATGNLMTGTAWTNDTTDKGVGYSGADNPNRFYTHQDLFTANGLQNFASHLAAAGVQTNDYNRYTYYRLLNELGTDSAPESGKMNLNYDNLTPSNGVASVTNYMAWEPIVFFTNAAQRLIANYFGTNASFFLDFKTNSAGAVSISRLHIPLYPTNHYTPSVHRLLQLAANIYDASTNRFTFTTAGANVNTNIAAPSVFRPVFTNDTTNIFIYGYAELTNAGQITNTFYRDLELPLDRAALITEGDSNMVYGVPCVVGVKKYLPNFNEFAMQTVMRATRKLVFIRENLSDVNSKVAFTNQIFELGVSNAFGAEFWNSYELKFPRTVEINITNEFFALLTNENASAYISAPNIFVGNITSNRTDVGNVFVVDAATNAWAAYSDKAAKYSFQIPLQTNSVFLNDLIYLAKNNANKFVSNVPAQGDTNYFFVPTTNWVLQIKSRLRAVMTDKLTGRILDYVNLAGMDHVINVTTNLLGITDINGNASADGQFWYTNRHNGSVLSTDPTILHDGGMNQILTSLDVPLHRVDPGIWQTYAGIPNNIDSQIAEFQYEMGFPVTKTAQTPLTRLPVFNAPFQPTRAIYIRESWQANDPLVHYTVADLTDLKKKTQSNPMSAAPLPSLTSNYLTKVNTRYEPWNWKDGNEETKVNLGYKDSLVKRAADWDFPTNKFPNIGWLGRVHRGTPWQTVFYKSSTNFDQAIWNRWTGNDLTNVFIKGTVTNFIPDIQYTTPTNDYLLPSVFTTAPNDNATRGRLNVNQTNLASWSAVLSGVLALDSNTNPVVIDPAGANNNSLLNAIVNGINAERSRILNTVTGVGGIITTNYVYPGQAFGELGGVLAAPELTVNSPFLGGTNAMNAIIDPTNSTMNDEVVERIPQQIMSLLRGGEQPRFVIYAYGQSLKPADHSIISSGLCTNYQITAETAIRAVVTVTNESGNFRTIVESYNPLPPD
jgi:hypothetical protein